MRPGWGPSALTEALGEWLYSRRARSWGLGQAEVETADPETLPAPAETPAAPAETKEGKDETTPSALDDAKDQAEERPARGGDAKPPEDGQCRECRRLRRLNRLKLCYPCWVELSLMDDMKKRGQEWKPGDKHPDFCGCEGLGEHPERDRGAWRGN